MALDKFDALCRDVVDLILSPDRPGFAILREQYVCSIVRDVEFTGVGFFLNYEVPVELPCAIPRNFTIGGFNADLDGVSHGVGFELFVRDGKIAFLEGFTYDEGWPDHITRYELENPYE